MTKQQRQTFARICGRCAAVLALLCAAGCVSQRGPASWRIIPDAALDPAAFATAQRAVREAFPPSYRATQRAIITVRKQQFVCDGLLVVSPSEGLHLALISTLGLVTEVRVKGDGSSEVLKVTPLFRETWAREYVARELRWLFAPPPQLALAGRLLDGRLVLEAVNQCEGVNIRYGFSADGSKWEELEVSNGSRRLFHAKLSRHKAIAGWPGAVPMEIDADAGAHQLHLRMAVIEVLGEEAP
jgi:hypothetical protein